MTSTEQTASSLLDNAKKQLDYARQAGQADDIAEWTEVVAILEGRLPIIRTVTLSDGKTIKLKSKLSFQDEIRVESMFRKLKAFGIDQTDHADDMADIALNITMAVIDTDKITREMLTVFFTNDDIAKIINAFVTDLQKNRERIANFRPDQPGIGVHGPSGPDRDDSPPVA